MRTLLSWTLAATVCLGFGAGCQACEDFFDGGGTDAGPRNGGVGDPCGSADNCRAGLICGADMACQPAGTGVAGSVCQLTGDCADGLFCGLSRTCEAAGTGTDGADCVATAECEAGLVCVIEGLSGRCRTPGAGDLGDLCMREEDCLAGLSCQTGTGGVLECASPNPAANTDGGAGTPPRLVPFWRGETCVEETAAARAYFDVPRGLDTDGDFYRLPFPNDARRSGSDLDLSGHPSPGTAVSVDIIDRYLRASETDLDGFATNPVVFFRFNQPYDWDSLGGQLQLVDITPGSPGYDTEGGLAWLTTAGPISKYICPNWLAMRRPHGVPLRPATTYAAVVKTGLRPAPALGGTFARAPDFDAMMQTSMPSEPALVPAWSAYAPLRAWAADTGVDPATILVAAVFTTQDPTALMDPLRTLIRGRSLPELLDLTVCDGTVASPCDDGTEQRACGSADAAFVEIHGRIALPIFQAGTPPYEEPEDGGGIGVGADGRPRLERTEPVCFALTVPRGVAPPADGFPLLIFAHGTGGSFRGAVSNGLAAALADGNAMGTVVQAATMAIDLPQHGARRGASTRAPEFLFYNFLNPRAARDNVVQGAADLLTLVHWATGFSMGAGSSPTGEAIDFDSARIALFAHSQGATHASLMVPFEPDLSAVILSGNGGDLTQSLLNKTEPIDIAHVVPFALLDPDRDGGLTTRDFHPALAIFQAYFERSDPVNFGRGLRNPPGRHVFMTYGLDDSYSPEPTMQAYSLSAGFTVVEPVLRAYGLGMTAPPVSGNVVIDATPFTMGLRQYMSDDPAVDGHFVATASVQGRADVLRFLLGAASSTTVAIGAP